MPCGVAAADLHLGRFIYSEKFEELEIISKEKEMLLNNDDHRWVVKNARGILLLLDKKSLVDLHVFHHDRWEEDRLDYLMSVMKRTKSSVDCKVYFFDVGSYFGQYSLVVKTEIPDVHALSFEANPYNYIQLRANILLNDYVDKIQTFNRCVTNVNGRTSVSKPDADNRGAAAVGSIYEGSEESIFVVDNLVMDTEFKDISDAVIFIKMDIEGSEPKALEGMAQLFERNRVFLQIEDWDFPEGDVSRRLKEMGCMPVRGMHPDYYYANFNVDAMSTT